MVDIPVSPPAPENVVPIREVQSERLKAFALQIAKERNIKYNFGNDHFTMNRKALTDRVFAGIAFMHDDRPERISERMLELVVTDLRRELRAREEARLSDALCRYENRPEEAQRELSKWISAVATEGKDLSHLVMKNWIWHIKRKFFEKPVIHHVMPVLYGATGSGKSVAVEKLVKPLSGLARDWSLEELGDERTWADLSNCYVGVIEELDRGQKASVEKLKKVITATSLTARALYTEQRISHSQNCTFIGTSNRPVLDVIPDTTSARRYWEIRCPAKLDWDLVNAIDYDLIWGAVRISDPCPLQGPELSLVQNLQHRKLRKLTPFEVWTEDCEVVRDLDSKKTTRELWALYCTWCQRSGEFPINLANFGRAMTSKGYERWKSDKLRGYSVRVDNPNPE